MWEANKLKRRGEGRGSEEPLFPFRTEKAEGRKGRTPQTGTELDGVPPTSFFGVYSLVFRVLTRDEGGGVDTLEPED